MSKKKRPRPEPVQAPADTQSPQGIAPSPFGYEEMLTELEAIISDAQARNALEER